MVGVVHPRVGRGLVKHPVRAPLLGGTISGAVMAADTPTDWSFVAITIAVMTTVVCSASVALRRRVGRAEYQVAEQVDAPSSNVHLRE
jgi:hypothetical protein